MSDRLAITVAALATTSILGAGVWLGGAGTTAQPLLQVAGEVIPPKVDPEDEDQHRQPFGPGVKSPYHSADGSHRRYCVARRSVLVAFRDARPPGAIGRHFINRRLADLRCTLSGPGQPADGRPKRCIIKSWTLRQDGTPMALPRAIAEAPGTRCFRGAAAMRKFLGRPEAEGIWWEADPL